MLQALLTMLKAGTVAGCNKCQVQRTGALGGCQMQYSFAAVCPNPQPATSPSHANTDTHIKKPCHSAASTAIATHPTAATSQGGTYQQHRPAQQYTMCQCSSHACIASCELCGKAAGFWSGTCQQKADVIVASKHCCCCCCCSSTSSLKPYQSIRPKYFKQAHHNHTYQAKCKRAVICQLPVVLGRTQHYITNNTSTMQYGWLIVQMPRNVVW